MFSILLTLKQNEGTLCFANGTRFTLRSLPAVLVKKVSTQSKMKMREFANGIQTHRTFLVVVG